MSVSETQVDEADKPPSRDGIEPRYAEVARKQGHAMKGYRIFAAVMAIIASIVLVAGAHTSVQTIKELTTESPGRDALVAQYKQFLCVQSAFRREVPRGASFVIDDGDVGQYQLIGEVSALWATPTPDLRPAPWHVSLVPGPECDGDRLKVVHRT